METEAATGGILQKKVFLEIYRPQASNFIGKENLVQVFSCELCKISKNTFFTEQLWTVLGQLPPRKTAPQITAPWIIALPRKFSPRIITSEEDCPLVNCPQGKLPPHHKVFPINNRPHSNKLLSKCAMSELRKTIHCLQVL